MLTSFVLKIIAIITMTIDHLGYTIFGGFSFFNYIGRLAFPIFAFQISEGYLHTRSKKNYLYRLAFFAFASQIPFSLFCSTFTTSFILNIFVTLLIGLISIIGYEQTTNKSIGLLLVACLASTANFIHADYGAFGVLAIFLFHIFKNNKLYMNLSYIALCILKYLPNLLQYGFAYQYILLMACTALPLIFINLYNGKKGISTKYILYGYYPVHLMILYVIKQVFFMPLI